MDPAVSAQKGSLYNNRLEKNGAGKKHDLIGSQITKIRTCLAITREGFEFPDKWRLP